jgi:lipid A ethanolaminephosphotransferase
MRLMFISPPTRTPRPAWWLIVIASLWMAVLGNLPLWQMLLAYPELDGWHRLSLIAGFSLMIAMVTASVLSLVAWRWTLKPAIAVLMLVCALASHYMWQYGIVVDTPMLINVLQTDSHEAGDQLSVMLGVQVLLLAVLPSWWLWRQPMKPLLWLHQIWHNLVVCVGGVAGMLVVLMVIYQDFSSLMRNQLMLRYQINPLNSLYAVLDLTVIPSEQVSGPLQTVAEDAHLARPAPTHKPPLLVLVLGETARSQNFSLNGYTRETNPELAKLPVVSFTHVSSCGTSTAESLPCMFSDLGRQGYSRSQANRENLLDVLQRAGLAVLWIDNQSGCKDQCARIPSLRTSQLKLPEHCSTGECHDSVMLSVIDAEIAKLPAERRARGTVVVLHQMGSHGPAYYKRTPAAFKHFQPECAQNSLSQCSQQELVNAYDNTLRYTDHFLASTIAWLKQQTHATGAMLYVSDHGESLGENNLYLHGLPYAVAPQTQTRVPLITWLSPEFEGWRGVSTACLRQGRDRALSHDHLFHSTLGLMGVGTQAYDRELDLFAACER